MKTKILLLSFLFGLGCSSGSITPGATLLSAIKRYHNEMAAIGSRPERWPERQRMASALKAVVAVTLERPAEFYRLIDLDLKTREFAITMPTLAPASERLQELTTDIAAMNSEVASLVERIRGRVAAIPVAVEDKIAALATKGLLTIALNSFVPGGLADRSTEVEGYLVSDLGGIAAVRSPDGQMFRCAVFETEEDGGAGVRCQAAQ